jgi:DNA-binding transcriptional ArsR family regulator
MPRPRNPADASAPDAVLRALADPHRRQILRLVQAQEMAAGQIAAGFPLTQQAISQHIAVLKQAGLLTERRDGTRRLYTLRHEALDLVRALLAEFWPDALARLKDAVERAHPPQKRDNAVSPGLPARTESAKLAEEEGR